MYNLIKKEDVIEVYSFGIFMNVHSQLIYYIFQHHSFFNGMFYFILTNIICNFTLKYSILQVLTHKFWTKNFNSISMPLLTNSISNVFALHLQIHELYISRYIIEFIILMGANYFINYNYPSEVECSKIFRFNITLFYFSLLLFC